jgi:tight adherence protein B
MTASVVVVAVSATLVVGGIIAARLWKVQSDKQALRRRLEELLDAGSANEPEEVTTQVEEFAWADSLGVGASVFDGLRQLIDRSAVEISLRLLLLLMCISAVLPAASAMLLGVPAIICLPIGAVCACLPVVALYLRAEERRNKLVDQLPDALDLMISVLRSGLSMPQAVRAVADEIPSPCGQEFSRALYRMNLGQSFNEALAATTDRYRVFELDLLRRASAIQMEVGGSLADLLDKTNQTLRQRIRLKRQVRVLTAQSRLSGTIIALLPFFIALGFQLFNPNYLNPLYETNVGKGFMLAALVLQVTGILIIRKLASFKV